MKSNFMVGVCRQCAQLTDECTCPAREYRQRLIEQARAEEAERRAVVRARRKGRR